MSEYRIEPAGPSVRLPDIEETPIGQETLFADLEAAAPSALLTSRFVVPPFSVLDGRAGYWQERKAQWLALGIKSELGRGETPGALPLTGYAGQVNRENYSRRQADLRSNLTGASPLPEWADNGTAHMTPGTSIFDPVLCEIAYRWFCPPRGHVLDPFAGGSVRGIVAAMLGHPYVGLDLSRAQVEANRTQADGLLANGSYPPPIWLQGDSARMSSLEVYGNDPGELSAMGTYAEFLQAYRRIIALAAERLRPDRFAVWVIGEVRDKDGFQRGLVPDTIRAFADAGLRLYNEAVLVTPVGTLALRAPRQFISGRTMGRSHQSVLVFWNGARRPAWKEYADAPVG
jgi:hypothetical protein